MSAATLVWRDRSAVDHARRLRNARWVSIAVHAALFAIFAVAPPSPLPDQPTYLAVDLVALPAPGAAPAAAPPTAAATPPAPEPPAAEPAPPEPAAAPAPKAPVEVLPENAPDPARQIRREHEAPKVVADARPRRRREKALSYEDAMAALGDDVSDDDTKDLLSAARSAADRAAAEAAASAERGEQTQAREGVEVSPEQLAWDREVSRRIKQRFPNFARYRGRGLAAQLEVVVTANGALRGEPKLVGSSGDLDFDRMVIAVVERAAPLPPPPRPGPRRFSLTSDER